jgi:Peptidase family M48
MDPLALARLVDESRPTPVSAAFKAQVLAALPKNGQVEDLDDRERRKLAGLAPVLEAAQRGSVYAIMIIDVPHAFVGLHERTVVLISRSALRFLSEDELRGALAHETAHEYVNDEYKRARAEDRRSRLQDLELVCDIIAVMTLRAIGQEARSLPAAIEKLQRFNWFHFGHEVDPDYPDVTLRRSIVLAVDKKISRIAGRR